MSPGARYTVGYDEASDLQFAFDYRYSQIIQDGLPIYDLTTRGGSMRSHIGERLERFVSSRSRKSLTGDDSWLKRRMVKFPVTACYSGLNRFCDFIIGLGVAELTPHS